MRRLDSIRLEPKMNLDELKAFVKAELIPFENSDRDDQSFDLKMVEKLHAMGVLQAVTPAALGGAGADVTDLIWVVRELGYGSPSMAVTFIGTLLGYSAPLLYGSEALRKSVSNEFLNSFFLFSFAMTEGEAGSDLQNIRTRADRVNGGFRLSGEKNYITNASFSQKISVFARLFDENGKEEGISCFLIENNPEGLTRGEAVRKIGAKRANTGTILFDRVFVPETHLLGNPGEGLKILTHCLNRSKTLLAAMGVGISQRALDLCYERLSKTDRFGKPLMAQPAVRHQLAKMNVQMESAWLMVSRAAATWDAQLPAVKEASMAKLVAGAASVSISSQAMELFGARGYLLDFEVSRLVNDAKAVEIVEGPTHVQELLVAKEVLPSTKPKAEKDLFRITDQDTRRKVA